MNFSINKPPPENLADYVIAPGTDNQEKFRTNLLRLLKQGAFHICTESIQIGWITSIQDAVESEYEISMQRAQVNFGELGTAHGIFYFARKP